jgi:hypothetical protein
MTLPSSHNEISNDVQGEVIGPSEDEATLVPQHPPYVPKPSTAALVTNISKLLASTSKDNPADQSKVGEYLRGQNGALYLHIQNLWKELEATGNKHKD